MPESSEADSTRPVVDAECKVERWALANEIAHDLSGPLCFFRVLLDHLARGGALEADDLAAGREEIQRMERLVQRLRSLREAESQS